GHVRSRRVVPDVHEAAYLGTRLPEDVQEVVGIRLVQPRIIDHLGLAAQLSTDVLPGLPGAAGAGAEHEIRDELLPGKPPSCPPAHLPAAVAFLLPLGRKARSMSGPPGSSPALACRMTMSCRRAVIASMLPGRAAWAKAGTREGGRLPGRGSGRRLLCRLLVV